MIPPLYHVSDRPDIARFDPRPAQHKLWGDLGSVVWAIEERLLHNYLLPRDCPRVTFYALPTSAPEDVARLMGSNASGHVVAVENRWLKQVRQGRLCLYRLPGETFRLCDAGAGYWVSSRPVIPLDVTMEDDLLTALRDRGVELRAVPSLWPLRDAVVASSLQYSCIRMGNALPREAAH